MHEQEQVTEEPDHNGGPTAAGSAVAWSRRKISPSLQVFCDESKSRGFVLAGAQVPCGAVAKLRGVVNELLLPRQVRLHFTTESPQRRT